jgi:hypothetical protein
MHDGRRARLIEAMQVGHRGIEREHRIERQRGRLAIERQRLVATQLDPIGIADRRDSGETVKRTAQHDREQPWIAALGLRELRHIGPGEQRAGGEQQMAAGRCVEIGGHWCISHSGVGRSRAASTVCSLSPLGRGVG